MLEKEKVDIVVVPDAYNCLIHMNDTGRLVNRELSSPLEDK